MKALAAAAALLVLAACSPAPKAETWTDEALLADVDSAIAELEAEGEAPGGSMSGEELVYTTESPDLPEGAKGGGWTVYAPGPAGSAALVDPPRDSAHPARNRQLVIPSGPVRPELGRPAEMNALLFLAAGEGPKPTLLLLHGLPGNERNLDLAQAVRRAGWNVLTFTYRGAWGSEGRFSIEHAMADAAAALAFLRGRQAVREYGIDTSRLVVAGHSMGGAAAAVAAANEAPIGDPPVAGLILLDAWDIAATARDLKGRSGVPYDRFVAGLDDLGQALGPITAADLADEVMRRGEAWDLMALAPRLARTPLLNVYAAQGNAGEMRALSEAVRRACPLRANRPDCRGRLTSLLLESDHAFADKRIALAREVVRWLQGLGSPD